MPARPPANDNYPRRRSLVRVLTKSPTGTNSCRRPAILVDVDQPEVYFSNNVVDATRAYTYDPLYRLILATGREHIDYGQPTGSDVTPLTDVPDPNNPQALTRYTEEYVYDEVGNILKMIHDAANGSGDWTRRYNYDTGGNRLVSTSTSGDIGEPTYTDYDASPAAAAQYSHAYEYDEHGNMTEIPLMGTLVWNDVDELHECPAGSSTLYMQYAGGQRIRKFEETTSAMTKERIYIGGWEIYRERSNGTTVSSETETLHVHDDAERVLMVEEKTVGSNQGTYWRYQLSDPLGSSGAETDETGAVFSYEEYHPFGTSAYRAHESTVHVNPRRYRFTGMERDESGLAYHGARYYMPWLGRWSASDPIGLGDGVNRWAYTQNNPVNFVDRVGTSTGSGSVSVSPPPLVENEDGQYVRRVVVEAPEQEFTPEEEAEFDREAELLRQAEQRGREAAQDPGVQFSFFLAARSASEASARYEASQQAYLDAARLKRQQEAVNKILQVGYAIERVAIAEVAIVAGAVATTGLIGLGVRASLAEVAGSGLGGFVEGTGTALQDGASGTDAVKSGLVSGATSAVLAPILLLGGRALVGGGSDVPVPTSRQAPPSGAVSFRKSLFEEVSEGTPAKRITPQEIVREMRKSAVGRESLEVLEQQGVRVRLDRSSVAPDGELGYHMQGSDTITVFTKNARNPREAAQTIIHESTHVAGFAGTQRAEAIAEIRAQKHFGELSLSAIRRIVLGVRDTYRFLPRG